MCPSNLPLAISHVLKCCPFKRNQPNRPYIGISMLAVTSRSTCVLVGIEKSHNLFQLPSLKNQPPKHHQHKTPRCYPHTITNSINNKYPKQQRQQQQEQQQQQQQTSFPAPWRMRYQKCLASNASFISGRFGNSLRSAMKSDLSEQLKSQ